MSERTKTPATTQEIYVGSLSASSGPFEGPEKLLEIWFAPSATKLPETASTNGLRAIDRKIWEDMLDIVKCKILSVVHGSDTDAYLLSESSFFVSAHRLILKTCGTTLNLLGVPRILEIASAHAGLHDVYRCFYSRKSFMFPERQIGPHRDWKYEVEFLDDIFMDGAAYSVGKVNGDHWLLYLTNPSDIEPAAALPPPVPSGNYPDYTVEILMSDLSPNGRAPFLTSSPACASTHAYELSARLGILKIFPPELTTLDAFSFSPCGYSSNALIKWGESEDVAGSRLARGESKTPGEGYFTMHVTPEEGWSYASFECNVPLRTRIIPSTDGRAFPDMKTLVQRVVGIFEPGRLSLTLFISSDSDEDAEGESIPTDKLCYKRTDKINYEFMGYELAFASFERR
ncbi:S-adenosylmethionine decarboxylase [Fistulina hepatica ATCC 64428]|uniref:S-adenosylmethionine decarboxylase proenzyme n=1 Tax=Fistulina hepatica ATCC 64428 TaxID=1128425 RepID=A0A0D7AFJ9_9AGAR|nr:S-adenosylmethionine decarboxylase [Fistulina hepatica ATCC 64428]